MRWGIWYFSEQKLNHKPKLNLNPGGTQSVSIPYMEHIGKPKSSVGIHSSSDRKSIRSCLITTAFMVSCWSVDDGTKWHLYRSLTLKGLRWSKWSVWSKTQYRMSSANILESKLGNFDQSLNHGLLLRNGEGIIPVPWKIERLQNFVDPSGVRKHLRCCSVMWFFVAFRPPDTWRFWKVINNTCWAKPIMWNEDHWTKWCFCFVYFSGKISFSAW